MSGYTSYLSNILTHTTSRYNSLRKILLSNEDDGDTEDDSHISRVLRAYYKEKGRPLPPWLPADPNDRRALTPQTEKQAAGGYFQRNAYTSNVQQQSALQRDRASLNDLWDAPAAAAPQQPSSLRAGRRMPGGARAEPQGNLAVPQARPLPSQRAGSYQSAQPAPPIHYSNQHGSAAAESNISLSGGSTAQERLKAKLWGRGSSSSNVNYTSGNNAYDQQQTNPYDSGDSGSGRRFGRVG